jgi:hypothetical protein
MEHSGFIYIDYTPTVDYQSSDLQACCNSSGGKNLDISPRKTAIGTSDLLLGDLGAINNV